MPLEWRNPQRAFYRLMYVCGPKKRLGLVVPHRAVCNRSLCKSGLKDQHGDAKCAANAPGLYHT